MSSSPQVVILAGGLATRLKPLTDAVPKSLVDIAGRPFLARQLDLLKRGGVTDIVLCVGHLGEMIEERFGDGRDFGVHLSYSYETKRLLGTAGALKNARHLLRDPFMVMNGDSYLTLDFSALMSYFKDKAVAGLMTVYRNEDRYDRSNVAVANGMVVRYSKKEKTPDMVYIDYGASVFQKSVLDSVPENEPYDLAAVYEELITRHHLSAFEVRQRFYEIGSPAGLAEFRAAVTMGELPA